ncbi:MAG: flagellar biosynthetic protein FliO [Thermoguttaceae bacterium]|nr:flagellar biosynthetic protein FliO [Thermoguttaceae bacterium]
MAKMPQIYRLLTKSFSLTACILFIYVVVMTAAAQSQESGFFRPDELAAPKASSTSERLPQTPVFTGQTAGTGVVSQGNTSYSPVLPSPNSTYATNTPPGLPAQAPRVAQAGTVPQGDRVTQYAPAVQNDGNNKQATSASTNAPARIPLAKQETSSGKSAAKAPKTFWGSLVTMFGSLILVLGVFLLIAWGMKKIVPGQSVILPNSVLQCLGQFPLTSRSRLYLLRFGKKLLLVSVCGDETSLVCEVENEDEVAELLTLLKSGGQPALRHGGPSQ